MLSGKMTNGIRLTETCVEILPADWIPFYCHARVRSSVHLPSTQPVL